ncbi:phosphoribosyltransferase family protein [Streptomyces lavendofoliae]|uniref:phosphoribosyltransferase family protein n=1 Tax=Streptomyces lavendofoliae TaxID=67314 RepID=UPI003570BB71
MEDTGDIKGATILLVDDVFTSGSQLQQVARRLRATGAAEVRGFSQESPGADDLTGASGPGG